MTGTAGGYQRPNYAVQAMPAGPLSSGNLTTADAIYAAVPGFGTVTVDRAGLYEVNLCMRGVIQNQTAAAISAHVMGALTVNGTPSSGTEAYLVGGLIQANAGLQGTGCSVFFINLAAGDVLGFAAARIGQAGTISVHSDGNGRSRLTAEWIR